MAEVKTKKTEEVSEAKARLIALIEAYKKKNPKKAELKAKEFEAKLGKL